MACDECNDIAFENKPLARAYHQIHWLQSQLREVTAERDTLRRERDALDAALGRQVERVRTGEALPRGTG